MPRRLSFSRQGRPSKDKADGERDDEPDDELVPDEPQPSKKTASRIGSAIKRPLSSLLRRPGSRAGSRERSAERRGSSQERGGAGDKGEDERPARGDKQEKLDRQESRDSMPVPAAESIELPQGETKARPATAAPKKATGLWSNGEITGNDSKKKFAPPKKGARPSTALSLRAGGGGMMEIPDGPVSTTSVTTAEVGKDIGHIEDITGYEFGGDVALAPTMAMTKMHDFSLDNKVLQHPVFTSLDSSIDMSLLLKHIVPERDCQEEQQPWTWDVLFTSVTSDIAAAAASGRLASGDDDHAVDVPNGI